MGVGAYDRPRTQAWVYSCDSVRHCGLATPSIQLLCSILAASATWQAAGSSAKIRRTGGTGWQVSGVPAHDWGPAGHMLDVMTGMVPQPGKAGR